MSDFLDQKRAEITKRLGELKPLVEEYQRLEAAAQALAGVAGTGASTSRASTSSAPSPAAAATRRGPGRPRKGTTAAAPAARTTASKGRRGGGRPKGSGVRAAQAVELVAKQPGITIPQLAAKMGIKQNYLYRVLPPLEQEGKVSRQGRGWFPAS